MRGSRRKSADALMCQPLSRLRREHPHLNPLPSREKNQTGGWGAAFWIGLQRVRFGASLEPARKWGGLRLIALVVTLTLAAAVGCYNNNTGDTNVGGAINFKLPAFPETGANAVQVFTEMHYQPSYRVQEGPRLLPPEGSVPISGRELRYASAEEYKGLTAPAEIVDRYNSTGGREAQRLFAVNCVVCHGISLKGDGPITTLIGADGDPAMDGGTLPADLTAPITRGSTNGELFGFISGGGRQGQASILRGRPTSSPMPEFQFLLTEEERWQLVLYLRGLIAP